ncbi:hypothetical protein [Scytonema millei]|uniref:Uncharacterized protein n=1 Tax=Scytonema millei VB511283 TaxID=1245923 RepID=A0A9X5E618_9CYAN|nr:hypothetical protein [Scytonema millei]NHC34692.1 hypothetical protein [Scytonema millei VB511283]
MRSEERWTESLSSLLNGLMSSSDKPFGSLIFIKAKGFVSIAPSSIAQLQQALIWVRQRFAAYTIFTPVFYPRIPKKYRQ